MSQLLRSRGTWLACAVVLSLCLPVHADLADAVLETVAEGLEDPVYVTHAGDDRLFVVLLRGQVVIVRDGQVAAEPFLDFSDRVPPNGHGLQGIAFHPDFATNGFVFLHRVDRQSRDALVTRVQVAADDPDRIDPASEVELVRIEKPLTRHYGGLVSFGPEGYLYVSTGDGSGNTDEGDSILDPLCAAQSLSSLEGKILRLDVDQNVDSPPYFGIPPSNPHADTSWPEIWARGLRNPWRISFDAETGGLWIGDVGEDGREEINFQPASSPGGENYGWKVMEATACIGDTSGCAEPVPACNSPQLVPPVLEYSHVNGHCSVTGGVVYRGSLVPDLYGRYLYGDFCSGTIWAAHQIGDAWTVQELPVELPTIVSFAEGPRGEVYLTGMGALYRLADPTVPAAGVVEFARAAAELTEGDGTALIGVRRRGEGSGEVMVRVLRTGGSAGGEDVPFTSETLTWADGENGTIELAVPVADDTEDETDENALLALEIVSGGAVVGARRQAEIVILDDDEPSCVSDATHLCLNRGRFRVSVDWRTSRGETGAGRAVELGEDSGSFWFFSPNNPEVFVKLLDGCFAPFDHYWVFAAGLTQVEVTLEVVDTDNGMVRRYFNPLGQVYEAITDTRAFATCP